MYVPPGNDPEYSRMRLDGIMGSRRLRFNPYSVSDRRLLEMVTASGWGGDLDITQTVILHFTRLRETNDCRGFDGIFMRVGNRAEEGFIHLSTFTYGVTADDTITRERSRIGKSQIRNDRDVRKLEGKTVFVSRIIRGVNIFGSFRGAYRMHRLTGRLPKDAATIREAMCAAKIEMLERILEHPECRCYLSCSKNFIDYEPRIRRAIDLIRRFPDTPTPPDE